MRPKTEPLLPLLGIAALLAASSSAAIGLTLGVATMIALVAAHAVFVLLRRHLPEPGKLLVHLLLLGTLVTAGGMAMQAWLPSLHREAGAFLPLVVITAAILGRGGDATLREALRAGGACLVVLAVLAALREWLGEGALFPPLALVLFAVVLAARNRWQARA